LTQASPNYGVRNENIYPLSASKNDLRRAGAVDPEVEEQGQPFREESGIVNPESTRYAPFAGSGVGNPDRARGSAIG
jgi:hypothetical protein